MQQLGLCLKWHISKQSKRSSRQKLDPRLTIIANPFMNVDISEISGWVAEPYSADCVEM